jgi:hypothetical protein
MRRTIVFDKLHRKPDSGPSRMLVTAAARYGVTEGNYTADYLKLLPAGKQLVDVGVGEGERRKTAFDFGIAPFEPFASLHARLKDRKVPPDDVLRDGLGSVGIANEDRELAAHVFLKNLELADS